MIPVLLFGAVLLMGLLSAGCDGSLEDTFGPPEPDEAEESAE